jgi:dihydroorotate dehydrogenase electron transfer subunit
MAITTPPAHELKPAFRPEGAFGCLPRPATILEIQVDNYRIRTFVLDASMPGAQPGQFVMAWLPGLEEAPFSLAHNAPVTLTVARVGPLTQAIHRLGVGDRLWLRGPYGQPFRAETVAQKPLLVGGGYGVAPLAYLAQTLLAHDQHPRALIGGRSAADVIGVERFQRLGVPTIVTTEDASLGQAGLVTAPVERLLQAGEGDALYGVGPHGMLEALKHLARVHGVPAQLSWEATIGCAVGLCGMCEHTDGTLLCVEGPVLRSGI